VKAGDDPIAVIVNKANAIDNLKSSQLTQIYTGKSERWSADGQRIVVLNRPIGTQIRRKFYWIVLKSKPTQKFFKLGSPIPFKRMVVKSDLAMRKFVARIPNAIGYIYLSKVNDTIKVLKIDGLLPGEKGYKLN
jgi:phosphate transport system substrate-binding protein